MPFQLIQDGLLREFRFYAPAAWQYWVKRAADEDGRNGLPLVIALHGGGQDPEAFSEDWSFHTLINPTSSTNWEDRFFVLYPHGFGTLTVANQPLRGWNSGFSGGGLPAQDDVKFLRSAVAAIENLLRAELEQAGMRYCPIDADRRFLFGYSNGGMMAYKLAHDVPDTFAALWVMSAAYGGRSHEGLNATVTNDPQGSSSVSLFAHHGEADVVIPPGPRNDPTGREPNSIEHGVYTAVGLQASEADIVVGSVRNLAAAVDSYILYNNCEPNWFAESATELDINGGNTSRKYTFRQDGNPPNPEVIVYRDPVMAHTGFTAPAAPRYFDAADVWDFFKAHPRVTL